MGVGEKYWAVLDRYWIAISIDSPEEFKRTFDEVPWPVGLLYAAHFCQSEVRNGGFTQFFWNSTGVLAPEAIEGFNVIGLPRIAAVVAQAVFLLGVPYCRTRDDRWQALERLAGSTADESLHAADRMTYKPVTVFEPLEDEFYRLIGSEREGFETAADEYAAGIQLDDKPSNRADTDNISSRPGALGLQSEADVQAMKQQMLRLKSDIQSLREKMGNLNELEENNVK